MRLVIDLSQVPAGTTDGKLLIEDEQKTGIKLDRVPKEDQEAVVLVALGQALIELVQGKNTSLKKAVEGSGDSHLTKKLGREQAALVQHDDERIPLEDEVDETQAAIDGLKAP